MYNDVEKNLAKNIADLRKSKNMKQSELGDKIGYSDKTVSKWENGVSAPDVNALCSLADFFNVTLDDLVSENAAEKTKNVDLKIEKEDRVNGVATLCLSIITVYLIAVTIFVGLQITSDYTFWQVFIWAIAPSAFFVYRYNRLNDDLRWINCVSLSVVCWSILTSTYLQLLSYNLWQLFFVMLPLQAMIVISTVFKKKKRPRDFYRFFNNDRLK